ncbi:MAG: FAD-binding oxidoreductase [Conexivisphaerales archaeon]
MSLKEELAKIIGPESVFDDPDEIQKHSIDMADFTGKPILVVKPRTTEQVSTIVKFAYQKRLPVVAWGAGSSLTGAAIADNAIVLDMSRFDRIIKIDTVEWYAHVEAGVVLDILNDQLKQFGFFFPPDPASSFICTVGGAVAEGSGGLRCVRYGTVKDWVLALKVVLPDGSVAVVGEPLPKNRAGYDLVHLFVGSEGTLGIITEAWLKIIPLPRVKIARIFAQFETWKSATRAIVEMRRRRLQPYLLEFMDGQTIEGVAGKIEISLPVYEASLLIDVEEMNKEELLSLLKECEVKNIIIPANEDEADQLYQARALSYLTLKQQTSGAQAEDVCVPIGKLEDYLSHVERVSKKYNIRIVVHGHAGDGNVHPLLLFDKNDPVSSRNARLAFEEICRYAIEQGGTTTGEHGIGLQKISFLREQLERHGGEEPLRIMKGIKKLIDERGIMNPGKYVEAA